MKSRLIRVEDVQVGDEVGVEDPRGRGKDMDPPYPLLWKTVSRVPEVSGVFNPSVLLTFYGEGQEHFFVGQQVLIRGR